MNTTRQVGDRIGGRYEVFDVHQGGMGVVYEVEDHHGGHGPRFLALKTLHRDLLNDRGRRSRFSRECAIWIRLGTHPHIVRAYAIEQLDGQPYLVLERAEGGELSNKIGTPGLDLTACLAIGVKFCLGMEHAIRQGLRCHRDVKPSNLMFGADGQLKITDFGIAGLRQEFLTWEPDDLNRPIEIDQSEGPGRIVYDDPRDRTPGRPRPTSPAPAASPTPINLDSTIGDLDATGDFIPNAGQPSLTTSFAHASRTGGMLGTLPYMAPEQFHDAHNADIRADIYSFGVVLYQMITSRLPFHGKSVAMFERQHALYPAPSVVPSIPRRHAREASAIDAVIQRCLAKQPGRRYADFMELRRDLSGLWRRGH